ncbi:MAG: glycerophosphodiester phosphodiesterase, partial [Firmicutes bacterium]|nr:glycerophosphodiester phosphodiesterase [Bacillota bacterium]
MINRNITMQSPKADILEELLKHRFAHRGLHKKPLIPENSMAAFRLAVDHGFGMEMDLHLTRDGKLAVIHDPSLLRTAGVDLIIEDLTLEEAQKYVLEESEGEVIPDFQELLDMVAGRVPLIVELKV